MSMQWQHLHHALQMRLYTWDHLQFPFFLNIFAFPSLTGSSLSHQSINVVPKTVLAHIWLSFLANSNLFLSIFGAGKRFASYCVSSIILSTSPENSRLSEHHPSFLEVVGDFTDTSFRVHFYSFHDLSVINSCCFLSRSGSYWLLVVSKLLISPWPLFLLEL